MSAVGKETSLFDIPVCNSFQAKVLNDQLCYEVDLNKFRHDDNIVRELKLGFTFIMDYNEDRQVTFDRDFSEQIEFGLTSSIMESDRNQYASIYLNTIGKIMLIYI